MSFSTFTAKIKDNVAFIASLISIVTFISTLIAWYSLRSESCNINGEWKFTFSIESSSMKSYIGKSAGYKIFIHQDGNKINGKGDKWWVDNIEIPYSQHDRFEFDGSDKNKLFNGNYVLYGTLKTTEGGFEMKIINDSVMIGVFAGTAADTKGHVIATRIKM
jgi:hypothetical protein